MDEENVGCGTNLAVIGGSTVAILLVFLLVTIIVSFIVVGAINAV